MTRRFALTVAVCALLVAGCSAGRSGWIPGNASVPDATNAFTANAGGVSMPFQINIPLSKGDAPAGLLHQRFVASSTQAIQFSIYKPNKPHVKKNLLGVSVVGLYTGAKGCKTTAKRRLCSGTLTLPPPAVDVVAATFDQKPKAGKIPPGAKQLAADAIANQKVKAGKRLSFVLGGIPVSVLISLPNSSIVNGVQTTSIPGVGPLVETMGVQALDADGNVILTDGFVNAAGESVGVTMSVAAAASNCGSSQLQNGTGTPAGSISITAPAPRGISFIYGASGIAVPFSTAGACSFNVSARIGRSTAAGRFVLTGPQLTEYPVSGNTAPQGITVGPDGNIWFSDTASADVGTINVATKTITTYPTQYATNSVLAYNGSLWAFSYGWVTQLSTSGSVENTFSYSDPTAQSSQQIALGPDNNFWFARPGSQLIDKLTTSGTATTFAPLSQPTPYPEGMTVGPDGNMWFTDVVGQAIERISTNGTNRAQFPIASSSAQYPDYIVTGGDGNLWFDSCGAGTIDVMVPSGANAGKITSMTLAASGGNRSQPWGLAVGPDQAIWVASIMTEDKAIYRVPYGAASNPSLIASFTVSHTPRWVTTGPDGAIWFTEYDQSTGGTTQGYIGRLMP